MYNINFIKISEELARFSGNKMKLELNTFKIFRIFWKFFGYLRINYYFCNGKSISADILAPHPFAL